MADEWWGRQKGLRQTLRTEVAVGRKAPDTQLDQWAITIRYEDESPNDERGAMPCPFRRTREKDRRHLSLRQHFALSMASIAVGMAGDASSNLQRYPHGPGTYFRHVAVHLRAHAKQIIRGAAVLKRSRDTKSRNTARRDRVCADPRILNLLWKVTPKGITQLASHLRP